MQIILVARFSSETDREQLSRQSTKNRLYFAMQFHTAIGELGSEHQAVLEVQNSPFFPFREHRDSSRVKDSVAKSRNTKAHYLRYKKTELELNVEDRQLLLD